MRLFFTIIILSSFSALFAQQGFELAPLQYNPILQSRAAADRQTYDRQLQALGVHTSALETRGLGACPVAPSSGITYLHPGDTVKFNVSTDTGITLSTVRLLTKNIAHGVVAQDAILKTVFTYIANTNVADTANELLDFTYDKHVQVGTYDTVAQKTVYKDSVFHILPEFAFRIGRRGVHVYISNTFPRDTFTSEICIPISVVNAKCDAFSLNNKQVGGLRLTNDRCFVYNTRRVAETDSVVFQVCNDYGTCDTTSYIVKVKGDTLSLPFLDDFSYSGPYPDKKLWLDNKVFINNTLGYRPPSLGVATFDALDETGKLYSSVVSSSVASADTLTSAYLDLGGLQKSDSVILSFYLQPKGLAYAPSRADSMLLEFRNPNGSWDVVKSYVNKDTLRVNDVVDFKYYVVVLDAPYLYKGFQFRFRNFAKLYGNFDIWHLDYVRLEKNRRSASGFADMALVAPPTPFLKNYTAIPWRHLKNNLAAELAPGVTVSMYNLFAGINNITDSRVSLTELTTGKSLYEPFVILNNNYGPGLRIQYQALSDAATASIISNLKDPVYASADSLVFATRITIKPNNEASGFPAVLRNDTAQTITNCTNYFAYDDGSAEIQYSALGAGTETALQFTATVADTLRALQFMFPHVNGDASGAFNLRIYQDSLPKNSKQASYTRFNVSPLYPSAVSAKDTLQAFTTIVLTDSSGKPKGLPIHAGKFFITWQNIGDIRIPIGLDRNNLTANVGKLFLNTSGAGVWDTIVKPNDTITQPFGALMVRAVFTKYTPRDTKTLPTNDLNANQWLNIYPNPARDKLYTELKNNQYPIEDYQFALFNGLGQLLQQRPLSGSPIDVSAYPAGWYFLKITNVRNNQSFNHKFVIAK